jgi:tetratricopeptide (TPR) repeat protein
MDTIDISDTINTIKHYILGIRNKADNYIECLFKLAKLFIKNNDNVNAIRTLEFAISKNCVDAYKMLGDIYLNKYNDLDKALFYFNLGMINNTYNPSDCCIEKIYNTIVSTKSFLIVNSFAVFEFCIYIIIIDNYIYFMFFMFFIFVSIMLSMNFLYLH